MSEGRDGSRLNPSGVGFGMAVVRGFSPTAIHIGPLRGRLLFVGFHPRLFMFGPFGAGMTSALTGRIDRRGMGADFLL